MSERGIGLRVRLCSPLRWVNKRALCGERDSESVLLDALAAVECICLVALLDAVYCLLACSLLLTLKHSLLLGLSAFIHFLTTLRQFSTLSRTRGHSRRKLPHALLQSLLLLRSKKQRIGRRLSKSFLSLQQPVE